MTNKKRKRRKDKIKEQVSRERAASRLVDIENGVKPARAKTHLTHKKDLFNKEDNTIKDYD